MNLQMARGALAEQQHAIPQLDRNDDFAGDPDLAVWSTMTPPADDLSNGIKLCSLCPNHIYNFDLKKM
jgi:hypothetical protein